MSILEKEKKLSRNAKIVESPIDDEMVMMNIDKGTYFGLDATGVTIWDALEEPLNLIELVNKLTEKFEVTAEQCEEDITPFVERLLEAEILLLSDKKE